MKIRIFLTLFLAATACFAQEAEKKPENIARKARITADSEYSAAYAAKFAADGIIPEAGMQTGGGHEWAVQGSTHRNGAELVMRWDAPVEIAEIVYYGRTSFAVESWRECELYLDESAEPSARAALTPGHGPQRIKLKNPVHAAALKIRFIGSHACLNPGAAEIEVYSSPPPEKSLGKFVALEPMSGAQGGPPMPLIPLIPESPELAEKLHSGKLGFNRMLLIKRHPYNISHVYVYHVESFKGGGGIYLITPDSQGGSKELIFDAGTGMIMDCTLSYSGEEILFSYKKKATPTEHKGTSEHLNHMYTERDTKYQVYRMNLSDRKPVLLTDHWSNNFNPCWLPDGRIAFLSDRKLSFAYCFTSSSPLLYRMDRDGSNVFKMSHGYLNDFTPSVLNDGRVIYTRWEYVDRPACPIQSLWTLTPDGTKLEGFFGNRTLEPGTFMEARSIGDTSKVLCVMTAHNGCCGERSALSTPLTDQTSRRASET